MFQQTGAMQARELMARENEMVQQLVLLALVPVVIAFSFIVFVFYRARREAYFQKKETEFKLSLAEGELKALRAQINPHFIFNCLNSIHHYMHSNDVARAGDYLVKFSKLIRYVLESSALRFVPLADEIDVNRIYIQLEQLRMNHTFTFEIFTDSALDTDNLEIPPMLIQPFVENAIWHGVATGGHLELHFAPFNDQHIQCVIKDGGKPTTQRSSHDLKGVVKKTSLGISLMRERFDTLNHVHGTQASFVLANRTDGMEGKQVTLTIPFQ
ncbi:MAG: hypothetical protein RI909_1148 [Bacteroidota bacterium]